MPKLAPEKPLPMTEFALWMEALQINRKTAAELLGKKPRMIAYYERGYWNNGKRCVPGITERKLMRVIRNGADPEPWPA